jgi:RNA polymerase sigma-70 factor (ECF subfamily)
MSLGMRADASGSTSHTLLARVGRQEPAAWERFTRLYGPVVYRWCTTAGLNPHDAADVMQEVFQAVFQGIARFQHQSAGQSLRGWLWTVTRNKICDHYRRRRNEPPGAGGAAGQQLLDQLAAVPEFDTEPTEKVAAELTHRALALLKTDFEPATWQAFWAVAVEEEPVADVAARLGMTTTAVYKAKSRVLARLRNELAGCLD